MRYKEHFFLLLTILILSTSSACSSSTPMMCSDNWKVTGYYTPVEDDYRGAERMISVRKIGMVVLKEKFLRQVKIEGWGKTRYGWYLGYYSNAWHTSEYPLNSKGQILKLGVVAVDSRMVPFSSKIRIPGLDLVLGQQIFIASDVGARVNKKHVDVYTGEGKQAKQLAYEITGNNIVCM